MNSMEKSVVSFNYVRAVRATGKARGEIRGLYFLEIQLNDLLAPRCNDGDAAEWLGI